MKFRISHRDTYEKIRSYAYEILTFHDPKKSCVASQLLASISHHKAITYFSFKYPIQDILYLLNLCLIKNYCPYKFIKLNGVNDQFVP